MAARTLMFATVCVVCGAGLQPRAAAQPGELDPTTGRLSLDGAAWSLPLDAPNPAVQVLERGILLVEGDAPYAADDRGLEGAGSLRIGGRYPRAGVDLAAAGAVETLTGRRIELRLWTRARGTDLDAWLQWRGEDPGEDHALRLALVATGRATDDGWQERSTGPVDFDFGQTLAARWLVLQDGGVARGRDPISGALRFTSGDTSRVDVDGLHVLDLGPRAIPAASCDTSDEAEVCGPGGACYVGRCVDAIVVAGRPPLSRAAREAVVERRLFELRALHAERNRHAALDGLASAARAVVDGPASDFYPGLGRAIDSGRFGHVSAPVASLAVGAPVGFCLGAGDADLLPGSPRLPLVFWADEAWPPTAALRPGDALVAVDGLSSVDWLARVDERPFLPLTLDVMLARWGFMDRELGVGGATLTFHRCPGPGVVPCTEDEVETIALSLAGALEPWVWGAPSEQPSAPAPIACDLRFRRVGGGAPDAAWTSVSFEDRAGGTRILQINGQPIDAAWASAVGAALEAGFERLVIDHRSGQGGASEMNHVLTNPLVEREAIGGFVQLPDLALDAPGVKTLVDACLAGSRSPEDCAELGVSAYPVRTPGAPAPQAGVPVAVLSGVVGSASEHLMMFLRARGAPLRIFGLGTTEADLAGIGVTPALDGELFGMVLQLYDIAPLPDANGPLPTPLAFLSNTGVESDVLCVQSQRDAVASVDTCLEEAIRWLEQ